MAFKTDKQRKAFFAGRGNSRSDITPRFFLVSEKGSKGKAVIETTSSRKTLIRKAGAPVTLKRISKSKATRLIRSARDRGFNAKPVIKVGRGRLKQITLHKRS